MKREHIVLGAASAVSLAIGSVSGFFLAKKKLEAHYVQIAEQEIAEAKQFYSVLHKKDEFETPEKAVEALIPQEVVEEALEEVAEIIATYQGKQEPQEEVTKMIIERTTEVEVVEHNVFEDGTVDEFDYNDELQYRTEENPYIISQEEFFENAGDYVQNTITFYEGDDTLADERDQPIEDIETTVGNYNLQKFGHGSKDKNIVYVRNDRLNVDFEVIRHRGNYAKEVLGFIEHSYDRRPRKFRDYDE